MNTENKASNTALLGLHISNDPYNGAYIEAAITTDGRRIPFIVEHDGELVPVGSVEPVPEGVIHPVPFQYKRHYPAGLRTDIDFGVDYQTVADSGELQPYSHQ
ncbi:hypothetical protein [Scandinavium sp.]|uniref:hypothetical protein n=1 Tax=Scandinavium sp. TaxID=2830653 RepID=UPI003F668A90